MAPEPILIAYLKNISHQSLCLYVYVAKKRLDKNVTAEKNTHATTEKLLDALFSMRSCRIKGEYPIVAGQRLDLHIPVATKNY
jgi:hypothetical protein